MVAVYKKLVFLRSKTHFLPNTIFISFKILAMFQNIEFRNLIKKNTKECNAFLRKELNLS